VKKATVLVVDDAAEVVEELKSWLQGFQYLVYTASCRDEALKIFLAHPIDIIITDLYISGMDGLVMLAEMVKIQEGVFCTVLTAQADQKSAITALNQGVAAYLLKPLDFKSLAHTLEKYQKRQAAQQSLISRLNHLESVVEFMADAVLVTTSGGEIQRVNRLGCEMLGYRKEEMVGQSLDCFISLKPILGCNGFENLFEKGSIGGVETTIISRDGKKKSVLLSASVCQGASDGISGMVLVAKDISDYKRSQNALRKREAQLVHTGRLTAMGEMAAGIAHELNQPLAVIRIWSQSIGNDVARGTVSENRVLKATQEIDQQMKRASTIITHMRAFARGDNDETAEEIDLAVPTHEALLFFREQFRIHDIQLDLQVGDNLPKVALHPSRFEQVVVNLLSNARHAVDKQRHKNRLLKKRIRLCLYTTPDKKRVVLEVDDNGVGMTESDMDRCLEPFFTTKEVGQGTGLGLHIIRGIVQEINGTIQVESRPQEGATFRVQLPAV
jgi:PAS domain S-box-containing protein